MLDIMHLNTCSQWEFFFFPDIYMSDCWCFSKIHLRMDVNKNRVWVRLVFLALKWAKSNSALLFPFAWNVWPIYRSRSLSCLREHMHAQATLLIFILFYFFIYLSNYVFGNSHRTGSYILPKFLDLSKKKNMRLQQKKRKKKK